MLIGYVRVSTNDQNTDLQRNALNCAGCERIFEDKISGTKSDRPGLKKLLRTLSAGDTLVVWKLDRRHCCKVSDEAAFCLIQRPYISKTLLTRRISPRGSP
ncbi:site-specific recombinase [Salmonella enterica subsp. enterica serovar Typhi]|nr:site-specific recombinase [Salmonella enterica subsp. enterica serovar Typhi]